MKKQLHVFVVIWSLLASFHTMAQTVDSTIYICNETTGVLRLSNLKPVGHCDERIVKTPVMNRMVVKPSQTHISDPQPAVRALIVSSRVLKVTQERRDASRTQILQAELRQAEQNLLMLQTKYQNDGNSSERFGSLKSDPQHVSQANDFQKRIILTQANINALQRELEHDGQ